MCSSQRGDAERGWRSAASISPEERGLQPVMQASIACRIIGGRIRPEIEMTSNTARISRGVAYGAGLIGGAYAVYAGTTWARFGHARTAVASERDPLLDRFMPTYDVVDRHRRFIAAPADMTFAAACDLDIEHSAFVRAIFRARQLVLGGAY